MSLSLEKERSAEATVTGIVRKIKHNVKTSRKDDAKS